MREVEVGKYVALVDNEDFTKVSAYKWRPYKGGDQSSYETVYAIAHSPMVKGKRHSVIMHRLIMDAPKGVKVDHRDFDGLNNQKYNLRLPTNTQSSAYRRSCAGSSSKFKGVSLDKRHGTWKSQITFEGKARWMGQYASEILAAKAYDKAALELYGEYAVLNFNEIQP